MRWLAGILLGISFCVAVYATGQQAPSGDASARPKAPCADVTLLRPHPLTELPPATQLAIRRAVEIDPSGGRNLIRSLDTNAPGYSVGGFGIQVLSPPSEPYPEIVVACSGFKEGGGSEAQATCFKRANGFYGVAACPATCQRNLNSR